ncbi:MAG: hypothetical protein JNJ83_14630 [Verrucomicrobiaceae bacterium]|nr:hypothetical protein [Verrucomicrobiaceae bacterium]
MEKDPIRIRQAAQTFKAFVATFPDPSTSASDLAAQGYNAQKVGETGGLIDSLRKLVADLDKLGSPSVSEQLEIVPEAVHLAIEGKLQKLTSDLQSDLLQKIGAAASQQAYQSSIGGDARRYQREVESIRGDLYMSFQSIFATVDSVLLTTHINDAKLLIAQASEDAAKNLDALSKEASRSVLTHQNVTELEKVITNYETSTTIWAWAFAIVSIATLRMLVWIVAENDKFGFCFGPIFRPLSASSELSEIASYMITKILLASFLFGLCVTTARMYQAHWQNLIINRQRRIAWVSFMSLYKSIDLADAGSKEQLVIQAAQSIFAHNNTGFLPSGTNEFSSLPSALTEFAKLAKKE